MTPSPSGTRYIAAEIQEALQLWSFPFLLVIFVSWQWGMSLWSSPKKYTWTNWIFKKKKKKSDKQCHKGDVYALCMSRLCVYKKLFDELCLKAHFNPPARAPLSKKKKKSEGGKPGHSPVKMYNGQPEMVHSWLGNQSIICVMLSQNTYSTRQTHTNDEQEIAVMVSLQSSRFFVAVNKSTFFVHCVLQLPFNHLWDLH